MILKLLFFILLFVSITLSADTEPPVILSTDPANNTYVASSEIILNITTNETAECRYDDEESGTSFSFMKSFQQTNSTTHTSSISLPANGTFNYYIICEDLAGNQNSEYWLHFSLNKSNINETGSYVTLNYSLAIGLKDDDNIRYGKDFIITRDNQITTGLIFGGSSSFGSFLDWDSYPNEYTLSLSQSRKQARFLLVLSNATLQEVISKVSTVKENRILSTRFRSHTPDFKGSIKTYIRLEYRDIDLTNRIYWDKGPVTLKLTNNGLVDEKPTISLLVIR